MVPCGISYREMQGAQPPQCISAAKIELGTKPCLESMETIPSHSAYVSVDAF